MSRRERNLVLVLAVLFVIAYLSSTISLRLSKTSARPSSDPPSSTLVFMLTNVVATPESLRPAPEEPRLVPAPQGQPNSRSVAPAAWRPYYLDLIDTSYRHSAEMRPGYQPVLP